MKISHVHAYAESLALKRPYTIAYRTVSEVKLVFLEIHTDEGLLGLGSANPSKMVVGEGPEETLATLRGPLLDFLHGADLRRMPALLREAEARFATQPGALAAIDMALHDLFTQHLGLPLSVYLGHYHEALPTSITIGIKGVAETLEEADEYLGMDFRCLKVKLGHSIDEDLERLYRLRESFGYDVAIRVDANQGYGHKDVLRLHEEAEGLQLELIEQPLPAKAVVEMRQLPGELRDYLAADESLLGPAEAFRLACPPRACGIFNIKLMKCGGIARALRMAEIARLSGIALMWGCNDESRIGIAAALHAAFACPHTRYIDLDGSFDLAYDLAEGGFVLDRGLMRLTGTPGLGVKKIP
jgi:L-Ala-D/L-Glu epimerase